LPFSGAGTKGAAEALLLISLLNRRDVAKVVRACQELPGQGLFQYEDAEG